MAIQRLSIADIPAEVRAQLVERLKSSDTKLLLASKKEGRPGSGTLIMALLAAAGAFYLLLGSDFGSIRGRDGIHPPWMIAIYIATFLVPLYAIAWRTPSGSGPSLGVAEGWYLLPRGLVQVAPSYLEITRLDVLSDWEAYTVGSALTIKIVHRYLPAVEFSVPSAKLEEAKTQLQEVWKTLGGAEPLEKADSLTASLFALPPAPPGTGVPQSSIWRRIAVAVVLASLLGPAAWYGRNRLSDDAMLKRAIDADNVETFKAYVDRGGRHAALVRDELLPKKRIADAERAGDVSTLRDLAAELPEGPHREAAAAAITKLNSVLVNEIDEAKKQLGEDRARIYTTMLARATKTRSQRVAVTVEKLVVRGMPVKDEKSAELRRFIPNYIDPTSKEAIVKRTVAEFEKSPPADLADRFINAAAVGLKDTTLGKFTRFELAPPDAPGTIAVLRIQPLVVVNSTTVTTRASGRLSYLQNSERADAMVMLFALCKLEAVGSEDVFTFRLTPETPDSMSIPYGSTAVKASLDACYTALPAAFKKSLWEKIEPKE